jgi:CHAD domain-containing protein
MAMTTREIEQKYEVGPGYQMPDLTRLPEVGEATAPREMELAATYYDTTDFRLATHSVTLRRRTGGSDAGWHLKLPAGPAERTEVRLPLGQGARTPPRELKTRVEVFTRGSELVPVAELTTRRVVYRLLGPDGTVLAEVDDDSVTASGLDRGFGAGATVMSWREVEVELVEGGRTLLSGARKLLLDAGATPSTSPSKLSRALAGRLPEPPQRPTPPARSAAAAVLGYLDEQVAALHSWDLGVRGGEPDSVHQMRVTTRRLRSALATFRPVFDRMVTDPVRDELKWLGGVLGAARDTEVMAEELLATIRAEPPELVLGPVTARVRSTLAGRQREAMAGVEAALSGQRYFALLDTLDRLLIEPPLVDRAGDAATRVLGDRTRSAWRRTRRAADHAATAAAGTARETALHEVRKAAKRARYAAEAAHPVIGKPAKSFGKRMKSVQQLLGEHQDAIIIDAELRQMGLQAHAAGENGFSFGRLHALYQTRAQRLRDDYGGVWQAAARKRYRRWMKG